MLHLHGINQIFKELFFKILHTLDIVLKRMEHRHKVNRIILYQIQHNYSILIGRCLIIGKKRLLTVQWSFFYTPETLVKSIVAFLTKEQKYEYREILRSALIRLTLLSVLYSNKLDFNVYLIESKRHSR